MGTKGRGARWAALLAGILGLWFCELGCGSGAKPDPVEVAVSPPAATLYPGQTQAFTATVTGSRETAVNWSVDGAGGGNASVGTISAQGVYTAPKAPPDPATVTVTATSSADSTRSANASVTVAPAVTVSVTPASATVLTGASEAFQASVAGTSQSAVSWSVNGMAGGAAAVGMISADGQYTAPATVPNPATVTIGASSQADPLASGSAQVTVTAPAIGVTVAPASARVDLGASETFTATLTNTSNAAVSWAVNGTVGGNSVVGTITAAGVYTAPASLPNPATVVISATSQADPTRSASAQVTLVQPDSALAISPTTATMSLRQADSEEQAFQISVPAQFSGTVRFSVSGLPPNVAATWTPAELNGGGTATLTLTSASFSLGQSHLPVTIGVQATPATGAALAAAATLDLSIAGWRGQVRTVAGVGGGVGFEDGAGVDDELQANAITNDGVHLYFVDGRGKALRQLDLASGEVTTLVGSPYSYAIPYGTGIAWDAQRERLYVADSDRNLILSYAMGGKEVATLAGSGVAGYADGAAAAAEFQNPRGLALAPDDSALYVADAGNALIRRIDLTAGTVATVAGQPGLQSTRDGGPGVEAVAFPWGLDLDPSGAVLYFTERYSNRIRQCVLATGLVSTLAGSGTLGEQDGAAAAATFSELGGLRVDPQGGLLYVVDGNAIRALTLGANPQVFTVAGGLGAGDSDGGGASASFNQPWDLTVIPDLSGAGASSLFVADTQNGLIRRIDIADVAAAAASGQANATVATVAGQAPHAGLVDGAGTGSDFSSVSTALFNLPQGVATDGHIAYIADSANNAIRAVDLGSGTVTTIAGGHVGNDDGPALQASFYHPAGVLLSPDGQTLYIADTAQSLIRKLDLTTMTVSTLAGGNPPGLVDGVGTAAHFNHPYGLAETADESTLLIADVGDNAIRALNLVTDAVTTIAGGQQGWVDGPAATAAFFDPTGLALTPDQTTLYISDFNNHLIRKLDLTTGTVSTVAGQYDVCGSQDGVGAAATLCSPAMLATDGRSLYWGDSLTGLLRVMNLGSGQVTTVAGAPGIVHMKDGDLEEAPGGLSGPVQFNEPFGVALAPDGSFLLITDTHANTLRILR